MKPYEVIEHTKNYQPAKQEELQQLLLNAKAEKNGSIPYLIHTPAGKGWCRPGKNQGCTWSDKTQKTLMGSASKKHWVRQ